MAFHVFSKCGPLACAALAALFFSACGKAPIETYRIPHEAAPSSQTAAAAMSGQAVATATGAPGIRWALPETWQALPDPSGVRKGSFVVRDDSHHEASITVTVFPGDVGGDLANVNRWLNQIGQTPIDEAALARLITETPLSAGVFKRVDLLGKGEAPGEGAHDHRQRTIGAWLMQDGRTWFFKMTGDAELVGSQLANFESFLESIRFAEADGPIDSTLNTPTGDITTR